MRRPRKYSRHSTQEPSGEPAAVHRTRAGVHDVSGEPRTRPGARRGTPAMSTSSEPRDHRHRQGIVRGYRDRNLPVVRLVRGAEPQVATTGPQAEDGGDRGCRRSEGSPPTVWRDIKVLNDHAYIVGDGEQRYFYQNDEIDELQGTVDGTRTIVWDLAELDDPVVAREYIGPVRASDHNLYVKGDRVYESNYGSGLRVLDISDRENPHEIAFFDSAPMNDDEPGHRAGQTWYNGRVLEDTSVMGAVAARHDIDQAGEGSGGRRT